MDGNLLVVKVNFFFGDLRDLRKCYFEFFFLNLICVFILDSYKDVLVFLELVVLWKDEFVFYFVRIYLIYLDGGSSFVGFWILVEEFSVEL